MAAGVNECIFIGNMTDDPQLKQGEDEKNDRCNFSIAVNKATSRDDVPPTYLDMVCWGKLAGQVADFGRKGRMVYVRGELEIRKWENDEGETRRKAQIKAYVVRFLDRKPRDDDDEDDPRRRKSRDDDSGSTRRRRPKDDASDFDDLPF